MPGILPMKVIKVGTTAQSRIAQACDRCRSKKIRCDGVTPCCSQCSNVGFECKTSDKLSRRAFPRGYTESLEERVRVLELETRELKDLLDEKDEKIDMLSRIYSFSPGSHRPSVTSIALGSGSQATSEHEKDDLIKIQQPSILMEDERQLEQYLMGPSSGRGFIDAFKTKLHESGRSSTTVDPRSFFGCSQSTPLQVSNSPKEPPRVVADHLINIFFQEWAPLFPVLHRPTFLKLYADYTSDPSCINAPHSIAQLNLVFGTAALASQSRKDLLTSYDCEWHTALESIISENSLSTLQCLALAQIHSIAKGDYTGLLKYAGIAVAMSNRLGLHQSQRQFSLGPLTLETRKKVFWSLYTLDCFSAAQLGTPRLFNDGIIECEEPADVDDENVSERGFHPALPGEFTKLSSALALFRAAKVLSKVLSEEYPAISSHAISTQRIFELSDELDEWRDGLAPHLRLEFAQDKPSTNIVSSRSPLLALAYYYVRSLIHRPIVSFGSGENSSAVVVLAEASKRIVQILQLLEERHLSFTMCLNKAELLALSGFGVLFQQLEVKSDGKLVRDNERLSLAIVDLLKRASLPTSIAFSKVAASLIPPDQFKKAAAHGNFSPPSDNPMSPPKVPPNYANSQLQAIASRLSFNGSRGPKNEPHTQHSNLAILQTTIPSNFSRYSNGVNVGSQVSLCSTVSEPATQSTTSSASPTTGFSGSTRDLPNCNLDYLPFKYSSAKPEHNPLTSKSAKHRHHPTTIRIPSSTTTTPSDWDQMNSNNYFPPLTLTPCDSATTTSPFYSSTSSNGVGNAILGPDFLSADALSLVSPALEWSPEAWGLIDDAGVRPEPHRQGSGASGGGGGGRGAPDSTVPGGQTSVFSLSEESLTSGSGENLTSCDFGTDFRGFAMPNGVGEGNSCRG